MDEVRDRLRDRYAAIAARDEIAAVEMQLEGVVALLEENRPLLIESLAGQRVRDLKTSLRFTSHRPFVGKLLILLKRLLLPFLRWLYEYSRDNFERQQAINRHLLACVEVLALENVRLRRDLGPSGPAAGEPGPADASGDPPAER